MEFAIKSFDDKTVLITGGTGSFGKAFLDFLLKFGNPKKVIVFSRDELKQFEMRDKFKNQNNIRWFIGDVRDKDRLKRAFSGVNIVIHAAALKQVETGEYNPREFILTNVIGAQNVIDSAIDSGVDKVVALSTDKASSPINLYGATKMTSDKLFTLSNVYSGTDKTLFSVVRYGNVMGSRGSIVPKILELKNLGKEIPLTDSRMTRFWITMDQAIKFVIESIEQMEGGEIFIPKIPSIRIGDLIKAIAPDSKIIKLGIRPGEKIHEEMIATDDSRLGIELENKYVLYQSIDSYLQNISKGKELSEFFTYRSDTNKNWLDLSQIKSLLSIK